MILAAFKRVVQTIKRMLQWFLGATKSLEKRMVRAMQELEDAHRAWWVESGADEERAVLPRAARKKLRLMVRRALEAARAKRHLFTSSPLRLAWAEKLAGSALSLMDKALVAVTGSVGYTWLRTTSVSPRSEHLKRVGRMYRWGQLEHEPGEDWGCKCGARPVFE